MGQRTIDTILRVQGEGNYKTALRNCTAELKVQKSELEKVTSEYRTNANSMEALTKKGEVLSRMYATQQQKVDLLRYAMEKAQSTRDSEEKTVSDLREQYAAAQQKLASFGETVGKASDEYKQQKAEVEKLQDAIIKHQAKLDSSTKSYSYYATQLNKAEVELDALTDQQEENMRLLDEAKNSADGCATSIDRYGEAVRDSADATGRSTSAVEAMAQAMVASGIQQKVEDLAAELHEASEAAQEYEVSIKKIGTVSDQTVLSHQAMKEGVLELSTDLRKNAGDVSDAVYEALSAGVETAHVLDFTKDASKLAVAGYTEVATSVDVLTTIINAYKLEMSETEKVASTLVKTQDLGKITVDDLGKVMGRVIPTAAAYRVDLNNIAAAYANMTARGVNAENTTTNLTAMLDELADSGSSVAGILQEKTGKSFAQLMEDGLSLADVLEIISKSVNNDQVQFSNLWSSANAGRAAISLFDGSAQAFNATLEQMIHSSGTVAKNYEQMTSTSEYSSQRVAVAAANLKIAVGDQLNPVLDGLRESSGEVLENATEAVRQNPALTAMIAGTVTGLGLLTTGLAGLMVVKSVTAAMAALNITMAANPAVLVATALVGLTAAVATMAAQIETTEERVESLTAASRALSETVAEGNSSYEDSVASAQAAADTVDRYIDRLAELESQGNLTQAQQAEYSILLEKISTLMPGINIELDAQGELLKDGADSLRKQAAAWKENAVAEAAYIRYKDDVAAMAEAEYELAKNRARLNISESDSLPIKERLAQITEELRDAQDHLNDVTKTGSTYLGYTSKEQAEAQKRVAALEAEYQDLSKQMVSNNIVQSDLKRAIEDGEKAIADASTEVNIATEAYKQMSQSIQEGSAKTGDAASDMADVIDEASQKSQEAYAEMYQSARDSLDKQIGLFDKVSQKSEMSTADMIKNLKSQRDAFENYATNLQLAMERGIDIGLVQQLSDGSVESMQIIAELVKSTDAQIDELNAVFAGVSEGKNNVATAIADIDKVIRDEMAEAAAAAEQGAKNVVDGLVISVKKNGPRYEAAMRSLAASGQKAYRNENMINSPAKKYEQLAEYDVQGLIVRYKANKPKVENAAAQLADAGYLAQIRARQARIPSFAAAVVAAPAAGRSGESLGLLRQILSKLAERQNIYLYPDVLIGQTASGYDAEFGRIKFMTDRGAY